MGLAAGDKGKVSPSGGQHGLAILLEENEDPSLNSVLTAYGYGGGADLDKQLRYILELGPTKKPLVTKESQIHFSNVQEALNEQLQGLEADPADEEGEYAEAAGRLGPSVVVMDRQNASGEIKFSDNNLSLDSQSNFTSCRANVCVYRGKWMFEATLVTAGIQQLGWATMNCPFTNEEGVGDAPDSYAYDGKRVKKWNVTRQPYGQSWVAGDVIGCCLDMESGEITFHRNGVSLGVAFSSVRRYSGDSSYLLGCLKRLVRLASGTEGKTSASRNCPGSADSLRAEQRAWFSEDDYTLLAASVVQHLGPNINTEYLVHSTLVPSLLDLHQSGDLNQPTAVHRCISLLLLLLEPHELQAGLPGVFDVLARRCSVSHVVPPSATQSSAHVHLALAIELAQEREVLELWAASDGFHAQLEQFLTRKQPNTQDLAALLPVVWWHGSTDELCSEGTPFAPPRASLVARRPLPAAAGAAP
eukprot:gene10087-11939_t